MTVTFTGKFCQKESRFSINAEANTDDLSPHIDFRFSNNHWTKSVANTRHNGRWSVETPLTRFPYNAHFTVGLTVQGKQIKIVGNGITMGLFPLVPEIPSTDIKRICTYGCGRLSSVTISTTVCHTTPILLTTPAVLTPPGPAVLTTSPLVELGGSGGTGDIEGGGTGSKFEPAYNPDLSNLFGGDETGEDEDKEETVDVTTPTPTTTHQQTLTAVGLSCSMFCLLLSVGVQIYNGNIKTTPGKIMVSLSMSLFSAQFLFMFVDYPFGNDMTCKVIAILEHLFWLLALSWSNTMVIDLLRAISSTSTTRTKRNSYAFYVALASATPVCIVITGIILDSQTSLFRYGLPGNCWIFYRPALIYSFMIPAAVSVTLNIALLVKVFMLIYRIRQSTRSLGDDAFLTHRRSAIIGLKLASVMGLTWIFGFLGALLGNVILLYMFSFFNSFQGVTMFFGLTYNHSRVKAWIKRRCNRNPQQERVTETSNVSTIT